MKRVLYIIYVTAIALAVTLFGGCEEQVFEYDFINNAGEEPTPTPTPGVSANKVIYYTSTDGKMITEPAGITGLVSHTCENGQGAITYNHDIKLIPDEAFKGYKTLKSIKLPSSVTSIGDKTFYNCVNLTSITIPSSVTSIGDNALESCTSLTSVTIPNGVTSIGNYAFDSCTKLTSITIPSSVTSIGNYAFRNCTSLTSVTIPNGVTSIGNYTFNNCKSLTSVTIPESVTSIGNDAFYNCIKLTSITIPNSVTSIGDSAFWFCNSLKRVDITDLEAWCKVEFSNYSANPIDNEADLYLNGSKLTELTIPNGITAIKPYTFSKCTSITNVTIPGHVTEIGNRAFYYCNNLTSAIIGEGVTAIGNEVFYYCSKLAEVYCKPTTPPTLGGDKAFTSNASNRMIFVPSESVDKYKYAPFWNTHKSSIVADPSADSSIATNTIEYTSTDGNIVTPKSAADFGANIVSNVYENGKGVITFDGPVTKIGGKTNVVNDRAFYDCRKLLSITIPNSVTSIESCAFMYCTGLTSVMIGSGVTYIGGDAFYSCTSLTSITIPDSVTSINSGVFGGCTSLKSFYGKYASEDNRCLILNGELISFAPAGLTKYSISESVTSIRSKAFDECSDLTSVTIPNSVTSIKSGAFTFCTSLNSFYGKFASEDNRCLIVNGVLTSFAPAGLTTYSIPASVTSIGSSTFSGYTLLTSVTIPDSVTSIGDNAFCYCSGLTNMTIPDSVTSIEFYAFYSCTSLTNVTIGNNVTSIGQSAFSSCYKLAEVYCKPTTPPTLGGSSVFDSNASGRKIYVPSASEDAYKAANYWSEYASQIVADPSSGSTTTEYVIEYTSTDGNIVTPYSTSVFGANIVSNVYENGKGTITFDGPVTKIGQQAFYKRSTLASITIPNSVTSIGNQTFYNCSSLTNITIPESVTSIGSNAFFDCTSLTSVTIPNSVTSIGERAFSRCTSLKSFYGKFASEDNRCLIINGELKSFAPAGLTSYIIPNSVTSIGNYAFYYCSGLTSVTIPNNVTSIGNYAFGYCSGLTSVTIPNNVTSIGTYAFRNCTSLTSVTIPNSVTSVGNYAFYGCTSLERVTIPNSVTSIGNYAFYGCSKLAEVYCKPTTPPTLGGSSVFDSNATDRKIYVPSASVDAYKTASNWSEYASQIVADPSSGSTTTEYVIEYTSSDGNIVTPYSTSVFGANIVSNVYENGKGIITFDGPVTTIGERAFYTRSTLVSITIPNSVTSIGNRAFYNCSSLTNITIPESVTSIVDYAFYGCTSLSSVTIPDSVTSIGNYAFSNCTSLTSVTIPESVTSIGNNAFYYCSGLTSVTIPNSVTEIGDRAFSRCASLKSFYGKFASDDNRCLIVNGVLTAFAPAGLTSYIIPNSVTSIGNNAFYYCSGLTSVTIPNNVTSIGNYAFGYCSGLTSVTIPNSVTSIGSSAFRSCTSLSSVTIPNSVTSIENYAFYGCTSLEHVTIPDSVTSIGNQAFYYCSKLAEVYCKPTTPPTLGGSYVFDTNASDRKIYVPSASVNAYKTATNWNEYASQIVADPSTIPSTDPKVIEYTSSDGNTITPYSTSVFGANIVSNVYENGKGTITFDGPVTTIGERAFYTRSTLVSITIPNSVTSIGNRAFFNCSSLTNITIPESVTSIVDYAFYNCSALMSVTIPESVTSIGDYAFYNCTSLTSVTIPNSVTEIGIAPFRRCTSLKSFYGKFASEDNRCLIVNGVLNSFAPAGLTSYIIPNSVTSIGNYAFYDCTKLTSVTIPNNVTSIGNNAFYNCTSLTSVTIPNSVTSIGTYAFGYCSGLTSVTIPNSVTSTGNNTFYKCTSLERVTIPNSVTSIGNLAFGYCSGLTSVTIPNSVTSIGNHAFAYCSKLAEVYCKPTTPPTLGGSAVFDDNATDRKIYVPSASVSAYKTATYWSEYASQIVADSSSASSTYYVEDAACGLSMKMIWVEGGTFTMGATAEQGSDPYDDEKPAHSVTVSSYYIAECEVTQAQWKKIMGTTINDLASSSSLKGVGDNYPIYYVTYDEAKEFCSKLSALTGKNYSLPTEAQWEYAARGGKYSKGYKYSGSSTIDEVSWYGSNSGSTAHPVKQKKANELGLYDMSGNIYEWCSDWWTSSYSSGSQIDPTGASTGTLRAKRGGSWVHGQTSSRVSDRGSYTPSIRSNDGGFRVVCK